MYMKDARLACRKTSSTLSSVWSGAVEGVHPMRDRDILSGGKQIRGGGGLMSYLLLGSQGCKGQQARGGDRRKDEAAI